MIQGLFFFFFLTLEDEVLRHYQCEILKTYVSDRMKDRRGAEQCVTVLLQASLVERIEEQHIVSATGDAVGPVVRTYLDELDRTFMTESQGADGAATYQETVFDAFGRVIRTSRP